jgi:hypothetical protein
MNFKLNGINATHYKLADCKEEIDDKEVSRIFKTGHVINHIYVKIKNGVLVIFCRAKNPHAELDLLVGILKQLVKDQKKKQLFQVTVFEYSL